MQTNAKFVLIIEKDATFQKLLDDGFHVIFEQCILVTVSTSWGFYSYSSLPLSNTVCFQQIWRLDFNFYI
jgi:hypothetical protein